MSQFNLKVGDKFKCDASYFEVAAVNYEAIDVIYDVYGPEDIYSNYLSLGYENAFDAALEDQGKQVSLINRPREEKVPFIFEYLGNGMVKEESTGKTFRFNYFDYLDRIDGQESFSFPKYYTSERCVYANDITDDYTDIMDEYVKFINDNPVVLYPSIGLVDVINDDNKSEIYDEYELYSDIKRQKIMEYVELIGKKRNLLVEKDIKKQKENMPKRGR